MPTRPTATQIAPAGIPTIEPKTPYEFLAVELRNQITSGKLQAGLPLPSVKQLGATHGTSPSTAQRAINLLAEWNLVEVNRGRRTFVTYSPHFADAVASPAPSSAAQFIPTPTQRSIHDLVLRKLGTPIAAFQAAADPGDANDLRDLLVGAIRRGGGDIAKIGDYDLTVSLPGAANPVTTFVASR